MLIFLYVIYNMRLLLLLFISNDNIFYKEAIIIICFKITYYVCEVFNIIIIIIGNVHIDYFIKILNYSYL